MNDLITKMSNILKGWTQLYDVMSALSMEVSVDERGLLCLNELPLCDSRDLLLESADFDTEAITFYFDKNRVIELRFHWPDDSNPMIESLVFGYQNVL